MKKICLSTYFPVMIITWQIRMRGLPPSFWFQFCIVPQKQLIQAIIMATASMPDSDSLYLEGNCRILHPVTNLRVNFFFIAYSFFFMARILCSDIRINTLPCQTKSVQRFPMKNKNMTEFLEKLTCSSLILVTCSLKMKSEWFSHCQEDRNHSY